MKFYRRFIDQVFKSRVSKNIKLLENTWMIKQVEAPPDFILCINGMFVALAMYDNPSSGEILSLINRSGGIGILIHPDSWVKVLTALTALSKGETYDRANLGTDLKPRT